MASAERDWAHFLRSAPLIDGDNDLLWELRKERQDGHLPTEVAEASRFQTDLPRLLAGGVGGQFWSVYVPSDLPPDAAVKQTLEQIDALFRLVASHPDRLELAATADDVERISVDGRVASMIGVEGGRAIGGSLGVLRTLARFAAGYLTLTHNDDTPWADAAIGEHPHGGLTRFGEEVVRELNRDGCSSTSRTSPTTRCGMRSRSPRRPRSSRTPPRARCATCRG